MPIIDLSFDAGDDLIAERLAAIPADGEGEHAFAPSVQVAPWPDRYSQAK
jgi:hypothetical protein